MSGFRSLTQDQQISYVNPYYIGFQFVTRGSAIEAPLVRQGGLCISERVRY
jgi:hypothetical protein